MNLHCGGNLIIHDYYGWLLAYLRYRYGIVAVAAAASLLVSLVF